MKKTLYGLFILSGFLGLVYEVLWARYLSLFIGNTTYAHAIVLGVFMGGMALGNLIFGPFSDKMRSPLRGYAVLEIIIGLYALLTPLLFLILRWVFISMAQYFMPGSLIVNIMKLLCASALILVPAILMGGTFPFMAKVFITSLAKVKNEVSHLYAANSIGAVFGTLCAAFVLIPRYGIRASIFMTAVASVLIGAYAYVLSQAPRQHNKKHIPQAKALKQTRAYPLSDVAKKICILAIGVSGFTAMSYEMAWFRLFSLILGSSIYAFSLMLAAFISGIAIGSLCIHLFSFKKPYRDVRLLAYCQLAIALCLSLSLFGYERMPFWFSVIRKQFISIPDAFYAFEAVKYAFCFVVMFIPTLFFGLMIPLTSLLFCDDNKSMGKGIGVVFASNTTGAVLGSFTAGFLLLPFFSLQNTFIITIALNGINGLIALFLFDKMAPTYRKVTWTFAGCVTLLLFLMNTTVPSWSFAVLNSGVFRKRQVFSSFKKFKEVHTKKEIVFAKDGSQVTVMVGRQSVGSGKGLFLKVNGKTDASTSGDKKNQLISSYLPVLLHDDPKDVLNIGVGSGITCGAMLDYPIESLDIVEISKAVYEGSKYFKEFNNAYFENPRTTVYFEDAKAYLKMRKKKYDIIASEPSNPWIAGIGSIFTKEFFRDVKKRLKPNGIVMQWFHIYEMGDPTILSIVRTMQQEFDYLYPWVVRGNDVLMIASNNPLTLSFDRLAKRMAIPVVSKRLKEVGIHDIPSFLLHQYMTPDYLKNVVPPNGPVNSDYFPYLEYQAPKDFFYKTRSVFFTQYDQKRLVASKEDPLFLSQYLNQYTLSEDNLEAMYQTIQYEKKYLLYLLPSLCLLWDSLYPESQHPAKQKLATIRKTIRMNMEQANNYKMEALKNKANPSNMFLYLETYYKLYIETKSALYALPLDEWNMYAKEIY